MFRIRDWERYKFVIDVEHQQARTFRCLHVNGQQPVRRLLFVLSSKKKSSQGTFLKISS